MVDRTRYVFPNPDTEVGALIKRRRLNVMIHSCIYYVLDQNIIDDNLWDDWAKELQELMKKHPNAYLDRFDYAFENWDASSGFDLPIRDPWVLSKANYLLNINEKRN
jgi:hypothetical protein